MNSKYVIALSLIIILPAKTLSEEFYDKFCKGNDYKENRSQEEQEKYLRFMRALRDGDVKVAQATIEPSFLSLTCEVGDIGLKRPEGHEPRHITSFGVVMRNAGNREQFRAMLQLLKANGQDFSAPVVYERSSHDDYLGRRAFPWAVAAGCGAIQDLQEAGMDIPYWAVAEFIWQEPLSKRLAWRACLAMGRAKALLNRKG